ncbi:MAG: hypothetical protein K0R68_1898 [Mycobacterium sp.]|nr:hypothetical protein [Mycobacterium sp.]
MAGPVGQVDERVPTTRGVQIRATDADHGRAHAGFAGGGLCFVDRFDGDVIESADDNSAVHGVHHAVYPPSATSTEPVMKDEASLARNTTDGAISSGMA